MLSSNTTSRPQPTSATSGTQGQVQGHGEAAPPNDHTQDVPFSPGSATRAGENEELVITSVRATDLGLGLRRIPAGFCAVVHHSGLEWRTENKPASVKNDVLEWSEQIPIPSDGSVTISLAILASFEFRPVLGNGEQLRRLTITVDELLDRSGKDVPFTFLPKDGDAASPCSSLLVTVRRQKCDSTSASKVIGYDCPTVESESELAHVTNQGHRALSAYRKHRQRRDLERAGEKFEHALNVCPLDHPCRAAALSNLATARLIHCRVYKADASLDTPLMLYRNALDRRPVGHPDRPSTLINLAGVHLARFQKGRDEGGAAQAEVLLQEVIDLSSGESYESQIAIFMVQLRAQHSTGAIQGSGPSSMEQHSTRLLTDVDPWILSEQLLDLFAQSGDLADLEQAISISKASIESIPPWDHRYCRGLTALGTALWYRYYRLGEFSDLEDAISKQQNAVDLTQDGHPDKLVYLSNLAISLRTRFERRGELSDLEAAISRQQNVVDLTPRGHPHKHASLNNLGNAFMARFQRLGELSDLEEAILRQQDAADLIPHDNPNKSLYLNNLGNSFLTRFMHLGDLSDLGAAISRQQNSVDLTPHGHPYKPARLTNLGNSFKIRFERLGELSDLEAAISRQQNAVDLTPHGHSQKPMYLDSLGGSLVARFMRLGEPSDLEAAISMQQNAVDIIPHDHPHKHIYLNNLGNTFAQCFERLGKLSDLEAAILRHQNAVDIIPHGHPNKPGCLSSLGNSLSIRFQRLGKLSDLEEAISRQQNAIELTPHGHPSKAMYLYSLGNSFIARFQRLGELSDLEKAISRQQNAIDLTPHGHPSKPSYLSNLGNSFGARFKRLGETSDLQHAVSLYSDAACAPVGPVADRFRASRLWISGARLLRHHSLLRAYSVALQLLPQLAWIGLSLARRYHELIQGADLIRDAAAAALDSGRPETAVEWLEQGRSIVWAELLQLRSSYDELSSAHPHHARKLRELSAALEHASSTRENYGRMVPGHDSEHRVTESLQQQADNHRRLAIKRDELLEDIRKLPGFERFLRHKEFSQLRASAHSGPVVILNAAESRCDALIVLDNLDHVIHVPLPNVSLERSKQLQTSLNKFIRDARSIPDDDREGHPMKVACHWESILSTLWKCIVKPVLDSLAISTPRDLLRIFWSPTGPFTFLPIHAAGLYDAKHSEPGHKVSDFVISSYIPTLSILATASPKSDPASSRNLRLLAVRQPPSDGQSPLPGAIAELEHIRAVISNSPSTRTTLTESSVGTVEEVLGLMKQADWVHFACHGIQDGANPTNSGLCLADRRRLSISEIIRLSRPHGGLAFLSACQTARGDEDLSDEAIHIAAGMLFAGYGGVVGTMWSISDALAPAVAKDVYEQLFRDSTTPDYREAARVLHVAVGRLRDAKASFNDWLPFIHVGL